jgi:hypothetical protein
VAFGCRDVVGAVHLDVSGTVRGGRGCGCRGCRLVVDGFVAHEVDSLDMIGDSIYY